MSCLVQICIVRSVEHVIIWKGSVVQFGLGHVFLQGRNAAIFFAALCLARQPANFVVPVLRVSSFVFDHYLLIPPQLWLRSGCPYLRCCLQTLNPLSIQNQALRNNHPASTACIVLKMNLSMISIPFTGALGKILLLNPNLILLVL